MVRLPSYNSVTGYVTCSEIALAIFSSCCVRFHLLKLSVATFRIRTLYFNKFVSGRTSSQIII